ncbi:MAG: class I SAM-dependent methyltransferase [Candidatus Micrarchaeota archaeon]|nr:class I SAM-dependent methyltransferase [Candidatus Micrarchaeota archaeon]
MQNVYNLIAEEWNEYKQKPLPAAEMLFIYAVGNAVLDAGTGNGRHLPLLAKKFEKVYAIDSSAKLLEIAKRNHSDLKVNFEVADVSLLPFPENSFDTILCTAVLHHLNAEDAVVAFNELRRVLKPGGVLLASVWNKHQQRFEKISGNEADVSWKMKSGNVVQRFVYFFEKKDVEQLAADAGFEVVEIFFEKNGEKSEQKGAGNLCFVLKKV